MTIFADTAERIDALDAGYALPSPWYTDREQFAREQDRILRRSWHIAGHTKALGDVGDRVVTAVAGIPVVLVRTDDGIAGFVNICGHRPHPVVTEDGSGTRLECRCGRSYDLDGRPTEPGGELTCLRSLQVAVWGPMVWANPDVEAPSFAEWTGDLPALVASHGVDVGAHVHTLEREWLIETNWKVFLDNAVECYHCPTCHPALSQVIETDPDKHVLTTGGPYRVTSETPFRKDVWRTYYGIETPDGAPPLYRFHWIFPSTYVQYKSSADFEVGTVETLGVDRIRFRHAVFMPAAADEETVARRKVSIDTGTTIDEDVAICERVQVAHRANAVPPGRLLPHSEEALLHFQRTILTMMAPAPAHDA